MKTINEKMDTLLKLLKKERGQRHPIEGHPLEAKEDLFKNRYLSHLCAVILYQNTASEGQHIMLERLIAGVKAENTADDYLRMSMEITDKSLAELVEKLKACDDDSDFSLEDVFALDVLIFCYLGECNDSQSDFIAELFDVLGIDGEDLTYLTQFCKAILTMDKDALSEAMNVRPENIGKEELVHYARLLGNDAVEIVTKTTLEELYEIAEGEKDADFVVSYLTLNENFTIGENLNYFAYGDSITFRECNFSSIKRLRFQNFNKVTFEDCTFSDFDTETMTIKLYDVKEAVFLRCEFTNCNRHYTRSSDCWKIWGCVIDCEHYTGTEIDIISCRFENCGGRNSGKYNICSSSFISDGQIRLCTDSVFENCWHYHYDSYDSCCKDWNDDRRVMFAYVTKAEDNIVIDSSKLC